MGTPVKIVHLAEQMIRLAGREPSREAGLEPDLESGRESVQEIAIQYVGLRPGEKLYEELFYAREDLVLTAHPKIKATRRQRVDTVAVQAGLDRLRDAVASNAPAPLLQALQTLVPDWRAGPEAWAGHAASGSQTAPMDAGGAPAQPTPAQATSARANPIQAMNRRAVDDDDANERLSA
jgi:hypothetical protein